MMSGSNPGGAAAAAPSTMSIAEAIGLGTKLEADGELDRAEAVLRSVVQQHPTNPIARNRLGAVLFRRGNIFEALYSFERAMKLDRRYAAAITNHGMLLGQLGHLDEAESELRRAAHLDPKNATIWNNIGNTLERAGRLTEALAAIERAIVLEPEHAINHMNHGCILSRLGHNALAERAFSTAIAHDPRLADAYYNRAIVRLAQGKPSGWDDYEWRFKSSERIYKSPSQAPRWAGERLSGKTILLWAEQGLGDTIQFARYVDMVSKAGPDHIILFVQTALRRLFRDGFRHVEVLSQEGNIPAHDLQCPLMSLPAVFKGEIPAPWYPTEQMLGCADCERWEDRLRPTGKRRIGLVWAGNPDHRNDRNRSMPIEAMQALVSMPGAEFYSLQRGGNPADRQAFGSRDLSEHLTDMRQTAHAVANLDLVITVDTAVAHLAPSMRTPTYLLLPMVSDWRWRAGDKTPWYPDITIFRQPRAGDWRAVIEAVRADLARKVAA